MLERESANCRVEVPKTGSGLVIMLEREITNGRVLCCDKIVKKRGIAKSVVAEPAGVVIERKGANSIFEFAVVVKDHRVSSNGRVPVAGGVEQHRCSANCSIGIRPGTAGEGQRSSTRSEEHTSELQSLTNLVCRLLLEKKNFSTLSQSTVCPSLNISNTS